VVHFEDMKLLGVGEDGVGDACLESAFLSKSFGSAKDVWDCDCEFDCCEFCIIDALLKPIFDKFKCGMKATLFFGRGGEWISLAVAASPSSTVRVVIRMATMLHAPLQPFTEFICTLESLPASRCRRERGAVSVCQREAIATLSAT
jgi:hypothetical protein